ncbi:MAG: DUF1553 domain-containing protein [Nitrospira sp.]|nr:DUF1553 domain-containing protein [Nitrospira sp.]
MRRRFDDALVALGRLDAVTALLPNADLLLYSFVRKEAVLSSQIEGTQSSLADLLLFEIHEEPGVPIDDARSTNPPSNPELLDAMAQDFIASGFDVKHLIRVITSSYAYGLESEDFDPRGRGRSPRATDHAVGCGESVGRLGARPATQAWTQGRGDRAAQLLGSRFRSDAGAGRRAWLRPRRRRSATAPCRRAGSRPGGRPPTPASSFPAARSRGRTCCRGSRAVGEDVARSDDGGVRDLEVEGVGRELEAQRLAVGADDYIIKPFDPIELLARVKQQNPAIKTKSGLMLGLGETLDEVLAVMRDLVERGDGR